MKQKLIHLLKESLDICFERGVLETRDIPSIEIEATKEEAHGDYATNVAMVLASLMKMNPRKIASLIVENILDNDGILEKVEIAGPGFINFFMKDILWVTLLEEVNDRNDTYGTSALGANKRVQVEFVSANPTGPLHIGHARGAVIGDVIANILKACSFSVSKEYYINDAGNQMNNLGKSVLLRYLELLGIHIEYPEECYQGQYIVDLAGEIIEKYGTRYKDNGSDDNIRFFTEYAAASILDGIKKDLEDFGVVFDCFFSEKTLYQNNGVEKLLHELGKKGYVYNDGATLWFKTTDFGDEKDRVVVRENGEPTYFAADIAYHKNKYERGFDTVIDIWGADHHGYVPRMYAGIQAIGKDKGALQVVLVQLVSLLRDGKPVAMSTRAGEFVTLGEVVAEVGKDASRYNFLMRRSHSHLDFDLELAKKQSNENPVYYVQYAHARISSILRTAQERGYAIPEYKDINVNLLNLPEELALIKTIDRFPELVEGSAQALEPHRITFFCNDLASLFHSYYNKNRVVSDDAELTKARLFLVKCIGIVLRNALRLLGVSAPDRM
ncbi:MAG TPA: arginine--tRNA ligase [Deltaproteobacteria bacterium]|nr:arginine--tRNA ligase [Deltaproteobacteria bacterium]